MASTFERVLNSNLNYFANGGTTGSTIRLTETESGFGPVYDVTIPLLFEKRNTSIDPQMYIIFSIPDELGHTTGVFQYMFSIDLPEPNDLALEYIIAS